MQDARIELLQNMPIFGGVKRETLEFLLAGCPLVTIPAGGDFFREGDEGVTLYVLEAGQAAVLTSWGGEDHPIGTVSAGDCFGEMAVMDHCQRSATVRAIHACTAIEISSAALYRVYAHDPKQFAMIQMNLGREVSRRLREANQRYTRPRHQDR
jgi:CRP-like cAMP-binding protein